MRRLLAILLLCVLGFPTALPLFAAGADQDAGLPACCRRNGAHHCSRMAPRAAERTRNNQIGAPQEKCPVYPASTSSMRYNDASLPGASSLLRHPAKAFAVLPTEAEKSSAVDRSQHERGPPS